MSNTFKQFPFGEEKREKVLFESAAKARLVVVIDTEEEFDWAKGFFRDNKAVNSMRFIGRIQKVFDHFGITPVYVIDYPIASQETGYRPLKEIFQSGRCLIGAHVHPWVNPPFEEEVNRFNSFPGNLSKKLELEKLRLLSEKIQENLEVAPILYKAGRYGIGPNTAEILDERGFKIDLSVCPYMDYSSEGGPDFTSFSPHPFWFGRNRNILEIPLTVGFSGFYRKRGGRFHKVASGPLLSKFHLIGILARLRIIDKIWLSPEGYSFTEHCRLVRDLYRDGVRIFSFAFHSPSVVPGNTPYVRSQSDLDAFIARCSKFFEFFIGEIGGAATTPLQVRAELLSMQQ